MNNGKAKIDNSLGRLTISIPSKKDWAILLFGTVWLVGWYFGFKSAISSFSYGGSGNVIIDDLMTSWLIGWASCGLGLMFFLSWGYFGKEILQISSNTMKFEKSIFGIGIKKSMALDKTKNFRFEKIDDQKSGGSRWAFWGLGSGKIKFDYGLKTYSFGLSVDDEEAVYLVNLLKETIEKKNY